MPLHSRWLGRYVMYMHQWCAPLSKVPEIGVFRHLASSAFLSWENRTCGKVGRERGRGRGKLKGENAELRGGEGGKQSAFGGYFPNFPDTKLPLQNTREVLLSPQRALYSSRRPTPMRGKSMTRKSHRTTLTSTDGCWT